MRFEVYLFRLLLDVLLTVLDDKTLIRSVHLLTSDVVDSAVSSSLCNLCALDSDLATTNVEHNTVLGSDGNIVSLRECVCTSSDLRTVSINDVPAVLEYGECDDTKTVDLDSFPRSSTVFVNRLVSSILLRISSLQEYALIL